MILAKDVNPMKFKSNRVIQLQQVVKDHHLPEML